MIKNQKRIISILFVIMAIITIVLPFVGDLSGVLAEPKITPEEFLSLRPYSELKSGIIIIEPSSSFFVFALAFITFIIGIVFLIKNNAQMSRKLWGWGMIFWGVSAASAGLSYQSFGYELKARGRDFVLYTSWPEIIYMILAFYSIAFLASAAGYIALDENKKRVKLNIFCAGYSLFYTVIMCIGVFTGSRALMSYNVFLIFNLVSFGILFILSIIHYIKYKDSLNKRIIIIGVGMGIVNLGYFIYLLSGIGEMLWKKYNFYFTSNDVLHILLIVWMIMQFIMLYKSLNDLKLKN